MTLLGSAFHGRRVLVTGHTGFKGAWLCAWLLDLGADPSGYALEPPTSPSLFERTRLADRMDHHIGDVRDLERLTRRVRETRPDVVLHLAAQSLVRESYRMPQATFEANVMGTANVLEAVRLREASCTVIVVTSDKCYENLGPRPRTEDDPLGGHDPYSASKGGAELVVSAYRRSFFAPARHAQHGVALASVRAGNVIGGGDWAEHRLVPDIIRALAARRAPEIRNPDAVRPWQHVLDALSGYLWLAALMMKRGPEGLAEPWNFGPVDARSVRVGELADRILALWPHQGWVRTSETDAPHETEVLRLDCSKAVRRLEWRPVWDVDAAIENTVRWYRAEHDGTDMAAFTSEQIHDYVDSARRMGLSWALDSAR